MPVVTHHFLDIGLIILCASLVAVLLSWFKQLPMVGYVVAGVLLGPACFNLIENEQQMYFVAELGVILLLFLLGMELPLQSFRKSYKPALMVTFGLVGLSLAMMFVIGLFIDLSLGEKIVYGFIMSLSSTAVAIKLLDAVELKDKGTGQIAISVLIAQDIIFVPMMTILNGLGYAGGINIMLFVKIFGALAVLLAVIAYLSRKEKSRCCFRTRWRSTRTSSPWRRWHGVLSAPAYRRLSACRPLTARLSPG